MRNIRIYSHNNGVGSRELSVELNSPLISHTSNGWKPFGPLRPFIINWGAREMPQLPATYINKPEAVRGVSNKLTFFQKFLENLEADFGRVVPWTTSKEVAKTWDKIVCRRLLTSHSGNGIIIVEGNEEIPNAPLYTRYIKKASEFRVHVAFGSVIDVQRKVRDPDREIVDWQVRSHQNGFIYVRNDVHAPEDVRSQALKVMRHTGLEFGAVDVIWNEREQRAYVLEVNTAPGITGQTTRSYGDAFRAYLNPLRAR